MPFSSKWTECLFPRKFLIQSAIDVKIEKKERKNNQKNIDSPFLHWIVIVIAANFMAGYWISKICISNAIFENWQTIFQIKCLRVIDTVVKCNDHNAKKQQWIIYATSNWKYVTKTSVTPSQRICRFISCWFHACSNNMHSIRFIGVSLFGLHIQYSSYV